MKLLKKLLVFTVGWPVIMIGLAIAFLFVLLASACRITIDFIIWVFE